MAMDSDMTAAAAFFFNAEAPPPSETHQESHFPSEKEHEDLWEAVSEDRHVSGDQEDALNNSEAANKGEVPTKTLESNAIDQQPPDFKPTDVSDKHSYHGRGLTGDDTMLSSARSRSHDFDKTNPSTVEGPVESSSDSCRNSAGNFSSASDHHLDTGNGKQFYRLETNRPARVHRGPPGRSQFSKAPCARGKQRHVAETESKSFAGWEALSRRSSRDSVWTVESDRGPQSDNHRPVPKFSENHSFGSEKIHSLVVPDSKSDAMRSEMAYASSPRSGFGDVASNTDTVKQGLDFHNSFCDNALSEEARNGSLDDHTKTSFFGPDNGYEEGVSMGLASIRVEPTSAPLNGGSSLEQPTVSHMVQHNVHKMPYSGLTLPAENKVTTDEVASPATFFDAGDENLSSLFSGMDTYEGPFSSQNHEGVDTAENVSCVFETSGPGLQNPSATYESTKEFVEKEDVFQHTHSAVSHIQESFGSRNQPNVDIVGTTTSNVSHGYNAATSNIPPAYNHTPHGQAYHGFSKAEPAVSVGFMANEERSSGSQSATQAMETPDEQIGFDPDSYRKRKELEKKEAQDKAEKTAEASKRMTRGPVQRKRTAHDIASHLAADQVSQWQRQIQNRQLSPKVESPVGGNQAAHVQQCQPREQLRHQRRIPQASVPPLVPAQSNYNSTSTGVLNRDVSMMPHSCLITETSDLNSCSFSNSASSVSGLVSQAVQVQHLAGEPKRYQRRIPQASVPPLVPAQSNYESTSIVSNVQDATTERNDCNTGKPPHLGSDSDNKWGGQNRKATVPSKTHAPSNFDFGLANEWSSHHSGVTAFEHSPSNFLNSGNGLASTNSTPSIFTFEPQVASIGGDVPAETPNKSMGALLVPSQARLPAHPKEAIVHRETSSRTICTPSVSIPPHSEGRPGVPVCFGTGGRIGMVSGGNVHLHNVQEVCKGEPVVQLMKLFPGPLVSGSVNKQRIEKFLDQAPNYLAHHLDTEKMSSFDETLYYEARLLCSVLQEIVRHDGKLVETKHGQGGRKGIKSECLGSISEVLQLCEGTSDYGPRFTPTQATVSAETVKGIDDLLVSGETETALETAMSYGLWGYAMLIGRLLGPDVEKRVVKQMISLEVPQCSALHTLFCGAIGESSNMTQSVADNNRNAPGDMATWARNIRALLHHPVVPVLDNLVSSGDMLLRQKGRPLAAHALYLLADLNLQKENEQQRRMVLIGADVERMGARMRKDAVGWMLTEIWEYSRLLRNTQGYSPLLQPYKLFFAHLLVEFGFTNKAKDYIHSMEKILRVSGASLPVVSHGVVTNEATTTRNKEYHPSFLTSLARLKERIVQVNDNRSASASVQAWVAKPLSNFLGKVLTESTEKNGAQKSSTNPAPPQTSIPPEKSTQNSQDTNQGAENQDSNGLFSLIKNPFGGSKKRVTVELNTPSTEPYYNESLGRWVFPGDTTDNNECSEPLKPPPTASLPSASKTGEATKCSQPNGSGPAVFGGVVMRNRTKGTGKGRTAANVNFMSFGSSQSTPSFTSENDVASKQMDTTKFRTEINSLENPSATVRDEMALGTAPRNSSFPNSVNHNAANHGQIYQDDTSYDLGSSESVQPLPLDGNADLNLQSGIDGGNTIEAIPAEMGGTGDQQDTGDQDENADSMPIGYTAPAPTDIHSDVSKDVDKDRQPVNQEVNGQDHIDGKEAAGAVDNVDQDIIAKWNWFYQWFIFEHGQQPEEVIGQYFWEWMGQQQRHQGTHATETVGQQSLPETENDFC